MVGLPSMERGVWRVVSENPERGVGSVLCSVMAWLTRLSDVSTKDHEMNSHSVRLPGWDRLCGFVLLGDGFSDKYQAVVRVGDVEFGHAVFAVEEISNPVAILERLHVLPQVMDADDLDVDFGVATDAVHNLF